MSSNMNVDIKPIDVFKVLNKYKELKQIVQDVEQGRWKGNATLEQMPVDKLEHMRFIIQELDKMGLGRVAEARENTIN